MMHAPLEISELIEIFRSGLIALIPVAERARIAWSGAGVYDPWERIERNLFASIVASTVDNAVPIPPCPLPEYGLSYPTYAYLSFITERAARLRGDWLVFLDLTTVGEPFDTIRFLEINAGFVPTGRTVAFALLEVKLELAARIGSSVEYRNSVECEE